MAKMSASTSEKVVGIKQFLGLHECPDGDDKLKMGEASVCENFKITKDGSLKKRAGTKLLYDLAGDADVPVKGMWHGTVSGHEVFLVACNGKLYSVYDELTGALLETPFEIGSIETDNEIGFIPFEEKLYLLNGVKYRQLYYSSGWVLEDISTGNGGYVPLIAITVPPAGGGELLEEVNKLNGKRRLWISPDGVGATFKMPEANLSSVDYVKDLGTNTTVPTADYTADLVNGTVTFGTAPVLGVNSYEIAYTVGENFAATVAAMRFGELYAGSQDTRIFIYGDGSNECFYTGIDYNGNPRGDYFPDLYEVAVGDSNTPITGIIRHYSTLVVYKPDCTFSIEYGLTTLADGSMTPSFYTAPMNRILGNEAVGQQQLVLNSPRTLCAGNLYEWKNGSSYSSNLSVDERQAKRISDRIYQTLGKFVLADCKTYDDNMNGEYFIIYNGECLVHNYVADAWYFYSGLNAYHILEFHGTQYIGTRDGKLLEFSEAYTSDMDVAIDCRWESGAMDFGAMYMRKYSAVMWLGIKPDLNNEVLVTVETDRSAENAMVSVEPEMTSELPQVKRCKVKVKKFTHFKLIFRSQNLYSRLTLVDAEIRVRFTSYAK